MTELSVRRLGNTELEVSPVGLGCWQFSKGKGMTGRYWSAISDEQIMEIVDCSIKGGINWFDSAEAYGGGESERALARALRTLNKNPADYVIATKWWPILRGAGSIIRTIDVRLRNLDVSQIDLYQIHLPFSFSSTRSEMRAMAKLIDKGKIRYVGLSNYSARAMRQAHDELAKFSTVLASNQVEFNLLNRSIESNGVLQSAKELGVSIIAYSPLAQGLLTGKYHEQPNLIRNVSSFRKIYTSFNRRKIEQCRPVIDLLTEIATKYGVTRSQIAINWVLSVHGETIVTIPGASSPGQACENLGAMQFQLFEEDIERLDRFSREYLESL